MAHDARITESLKCRFFVPLFLSNSGPVLEHKGMVGSRFRGTFEQVFSRDKIGSGRPTK